MTAHVDVMRIARIDKLSSYWTDYFDEHQRRLSDVYDISNADARVATAALLAYFRCKRLRPREVLILPQLVDWAWHEFIIDTRRYSDFCDTYFGYYLHHVKARHRGPAIAFLEERFHVTQRLLKESSQVEIEASLWNEAGWIRPEYRWRSEKRFPYFDQTNPLHVSDAVAALDLGWIEERVSERYGLSAIEAQCILYRYKSYLSKRMEAAEEASEICDVAWREHILSAVKYHRDCHALFGSYLHRTN
jgi:hypothetical protein